MKALLKTRCGCSQELEVSEPLSKYYRVYMMRPFSEWFDLNNLRHPDDRVPVDSRMFELHDIEGSGKDGRAIYHESYTETV